MANCPELPKRRQYIGARYVPKFADPIDWDSTLSYEPLTVVNYGNTSYTSKRCVPPGTPPTDTCYWVATGRYNAQVEEYHQEVLNLKDQIGGIGPDITQIKSDITTLQGDIGTVKTDVSTNTTNITQNRTDITALQTALTTAQSDITTLQTDLGSVKSDIATLQTDMGSAQTDITQNKQDITALDTRVTALETRAGTIESTIDDHLYITVRGVKRPRIINNELTLNVPAEFPNATAAINEYLQFCIIHNNVTIKYADGTYNGTALNIVNFKSTYVRIAGNTTAPQNVIIRLSAGETAFALNNSDVLSIDGFHIIGDVAGAYPNLSSGTTSGFGLTLSNTLIGKSLIFERLGTGVLIDTSFFGTTEAFSNNPSDIDDNTLPNYYGKNIIFFNCNRVASGPINISGAICYNITENAAFIAFNGLLLIRNTTIKNVNTAISGVNIHLSINNVTILSVNDYGIYAAGCQINIDKLTINGGKMCIVTTNSFINSSSLTLENATNSAIQLSNGSSISIYNINTISNCPIGIYCDIWYEIAFPVNITFNNVPTKYYILLNRSTGHDSTQTNFLGQVILSVQPSNYVGEVCTETGMPGTWKTFGAIQP